MQAILADVRRRNAEAVEAAQAHKEVLAERDAAVADARRIEDEINDVEEEKALLAAALDDVMHGVYIERRMRQAEADAAQLEVRRWYPVGLFCWIAVPRWLVGFQAVAGCVL